MVGDVAPGQVCAERDEDERDHHVSHRRDEDTKVALVVRVHREAEPIHVADDQPGQESTEVAAATRLADRAEAAGDHGQQGQRRRTRSNSGIRIAGSVGANAAPINKPEDKGRPKALAATPPVIPAVRITPGTTSMSSPTTTPPRTRVESCRPPWKRMKETPIVSSSCGPMESSGTSIAPETDGPSSAPAKRRTSMRGARR